jgi:hypothetical protein
MSSEEKVSYIGDMISNFKMHHCDGKKKNETPQIKRG